MLIMKDSRVYIGKEDNLIDKKIKLDLWVDQSDKDMIRIILLTPQKYYFA